MRRPYRSPRTLFPFLLSIFFGILVAVALATLT